MLITSARLVLVNLLMWTRDHLFRPDYAHATTKTLLPFFCLPGRDLTEFCQRVNDAHLCLPAGKTLIFRVAESDRPISNFSP